MAALFQTLGISAALLLAGCGTAAPPAELACLTIEVDVQDQSLIGIEDMAILNGNTLLLSAYNRHDVTASPQGLFLLKVPQSGLQWDAKPLTPAGKLVPHGIAYDQKHATLYVIDRSNETPQILRYTVTSDMSLARGTPTLAPTQTPAKPPYPCHLNDLTVTASGDLLFTNDRHSCSTSGQLMDNVFGRKNGSVWQMTPEGDLVARAQNLYFPNGIAETADGDILVALTRGNSLFNVTTGATQPLDGSPDNLLVGTDGAIWSAAIGSLPRYALYGRRLASSAGPSIVIRLSEVTDVFSVRTYSGATSAVQMGERLYLSGAYSRGIASCELPNDT